MTTVPSSASSSIGQFGAGVIWLLAGRIGQVVITLITVPLLSRLLTPTEFGIMAAITIVQSLGVAIAEGGFAAPIIQRRDISISTRDAAFFLTGALGLLLCILIAISAPVIEKLFSIDGLAYPLLIAVATLPLKASSAVLEALMTRHHQYRELTIARNMSYCVGYSIPAVIMAWNGFGIWSLVIPTVAAAFVELIYAILIVRAPSTITFRMEDREMLRSGAAMTLTNILNWAALTTPNAIVGFANGAEALGLYARAGKIYSLMTQLFVDTVMPAFFSGLSSLKADEQGTIALHRALSILIPFYLGVATLLVIHAEAIVRVMLGDQWLTIIPVVQVLFVAFAGRAGYKMAESFALSRGAFGGAAIRQGIYLIAVIPCVIAGSRFGLLGVAVGFAAAIWLFYAVSMTWSVSIAGIKWSSLALIHLRSIIFILPAYYCDLSVRWSFEQAHWLLAHSISGAVGVSTALAIAYFAPEVLVGRELTWARRTFRKALIRKLNNG